MPRTSPPFSFALTALRTARGWSQKELAQVTGIASDLLSDYERGRKTLSRERLELLAAAMGLDPEAIDAALYFFRLVGPEPEREDAPGALRGGEVRVVRRAMAATARTTAEVVGTELARTFRAARIQREREEAAAFWERLRKEPPPERRRLVEALEEAPAWAVCERLCAESERAAAADVGRAQELADLALRAAALAPGTEAWRSRLQGYAWAHVGNALRVASDLPGAEKAFARARSLWKAGMGSDPGGLLEEALVLDLEASLRRDQRRFGEALELQDRALAVTAAEKSGFILLSKAFTLEQMGDCVRAIEVLQQAAPLLDERTEARLLCVLHFNLAVNLCGEGRHAEAAALLPKLRKMAVRLSNAMDLVRVLWLEGRIAIGMGRPAEAVAALEQVRREFAARGITYDTALVSLELAVLYLEEGRLEKVRELARQMESIFRAQGVHREALAALRLFSEAADRQEASVELARRLAIYLQGARHDPKLCFEG